MAESLNEKRRSLVCTDGVHPSYLLNRGWITFNRGLAASKEGKYKEAEQLFIEANNIYSKTPASDFAALDYEANPGKRSKKYQLLNCEFEALSMRMKEPGKYTKELNILLEKYQNLVKEDNASARELGMEDRLLFDVARIQRAIAEQPENQKNVELLEDILQMQEERIYPALEKVYGTQPDLFNRFPTVAITFVKLSERYEDAGNLNEAIKCQKRAVEINHRAYGQHNRYTKAAKQRLLNLEKQQDERETEV